MPATWFFTGAQSIYILLGQRKKVNVRQLAIVVSLAAIFGTMTSDFLFAHVSAGIMKACLGVFIVTNSVYELYGLYRRKKRQGLKPWHYLYPIGSGALQSSYGIGGPLLVAYLNKTIEDKDELRSTICGYWAFLNTFLLGKYVLAGHMTAESVRICLLLIPAVIAGCMAGGVVLKKTNQKAFSIGIHCILMISVVFMII